MCVSTLFGHVCDELSGHVWVKLSGHIRGPKKSLITILFQDSFGRTPICTQYFTPPGLTIELTSGRS